MSTEVKLDMELHAEDKFSASFKKLMRVADRAKETLERMGGSRISRRFLELSSSVGDVRSKLGGLGSALGSASSLLGGLGVAGGLAGGGILALTTEVAESGRELARLAQAAGVSTTRMQELHHAANMNGLEAEELSMQMATLNEHIVEAGSGNEDLVATFDALGVSVKDSSGKLKKSDAVLLEMADAFEKMEDGPAKSAIAIKLFGDAGLLMLPMLSKGSNEIENLGKEAHNLGLIMSDDAISASKGFSSSLAQLMSQIKSFAQSIGVALMPHIQALMGQLKIWIGENKALVTQRIVEWVQSFGQALPAIIEGISGVFSAIATLCSWLAPAIEFLGGAKVALGIMAAVLAGPLILALAIAGKAIFAFGLVLMANPIGGAIVLITGLIATFLYFKDSILKFINAIIEGIPDFIFDWLGTDKKSMKFDVEVDSSELDALDKDELVKKHGGVANSEMSDGLEQSELDSYASDPFGQAMPSQGQQGFGKALPISPLTSSSASSHVSETKIEKSEIRLILPEGVTALGGENAKGVTVDQSGLGYQTNWG